MSQDGYVAIGQDRDVGADCPRLRRPPAGAGQALQIYQIQGNFTL